MIKMLKSEEWKRIRIRTKINTRRNFSFDEFFKTKWNFTVIDIYPSNVIPQSHSDLFTMFTLKRVHQGCTLLRFHTRGYDRTNLSNLIKMTVINSNDPSTNKLTDLTINRSVQLQISSSRIYLVLLIQVRC